MNVTQSCNTKSLSPYTPTGSNPWDIDKARHIYRRLDFGAPQSQLHLALTKNPQEVIDELINTAKNSDNTKAPDWAYHTRVDYGNEYGTAMRAYYEEWYRTTIHQAVEGGLKARLTFFWLNHFVTQLEIYRHTPYSFQYWDVLQKHCLGNFKDFVKEIGLTPAMLIFLDGWKSSKHHPNENYARELYELFTLGENNGYTQTDIEETSRALTGYTLRRVEGGPIIFDETQFDNSDKTIFGNTGNWGYDDVIDNLFSKRGDKVAHFIAQKLYTFFVSPTPDPGIIDEMAQTFIAADFEIAPMLSQLFKSEHFFDSTSHGVIIKSPLDITVSFLKETNLNYNTENVDDNLVYAYIKHMLKLLGQDIYDPIDVAGWQRNRAWINTGTITTRWLEMAELTWRVVRASNDEAQFASFAKIITDNSNDTAYITKTLVDYFIAKPLENEAYYASAEVVLRGDLPNNYYEEGKWNLDWSSAPRQIIYLLHYIFKLPEFQLK